jgi:hypothetical protein
MAIQVQAFMEFLLVGGACLTLLVVASRALREAIGLPLEGARGQIEHQVVTLYVVGGVSGLVGLILLIVFLSTAPYNASAMVDPVGRKAMDAAEAQVRASRCGEKK